MRIALAATLFALAFCGSTASSATLYTLGTYPGHKFFSIDTGTGVMTEGDWTEWALGANDLTFHGGRAYVIYRFASCVYFQTEAVPYSFYDPATGEWGPIIQYVMAGGSALPIREMGGLATDGTTMYFSYRAGVSGCGNVNRIAELSPNGTASNERVFPDDVDLDRIVFTPDGRLLSLDTADGTGQTSVYEVDLGTLTLTLLGTHANSDLSGIYSDMEFDSDGILWALERTNSVTVQELRQIDPLTGQIGITHQLPREFLPGLQRYQYFRGLVNLPFLPTPAAAASWGQLKHTYR